MESAKKRILIITYYWPPSGGAGVQRWLRFAKHLRNFGYEPVIYTPDDPKYAVYDHNLVNEIPDGIQTLKLKIREPNSFVSKLLFWKKDKGALLYSNQEQKGAKKSFFQKIIWFIRGNFFIPDSRFLWIKPSFRYLSKELHKQKYEAIISTGPPHSMHMIALKLHEKFGIPWLADFRDPWTTIDYMHEMHLTRYAQKKHFRLEKKVVQSATKVVVIGRTMSNEFEANHQVKSVIIHNGYNDLSAELMNIPADKKFTIVHVGSFSTYRNCDDLWEVLAEMIQKNSSFSEKLEIRLVGNIAPNVLESINKYGLNSHLNIIPYVPYEKSLEYLSSAQVLLLPINRVENAEFILTGKMFEYLRAKRPILLIGPVHGDAADIIQSCNAGYCCNFDDKQALEKAVSTMFDLYKQGKNTINSSSIEKFSAKELTGSLAKILDEITKRSSNQID